jgi:hypothetical protein
MRSLRTGQDYLPALRSFSSNASDVAICSVINMSIFAAEEFHDIAPPIDYSQFLRWPYLLRQSSDCDYRLAWLIVRSWKRGSAIAAGVSQRSTHAAVEKMQPYQFSIRVSDILHVM